MLCQVNSALCCMNKDGTLLVTSCIICRTHLMTILHVHHKSSFQCKSFRMWLVFASIQVAARMAMPTAILLQRNDNTFSRLVATHSRCTRENILVIEGRRL